MWSVLVNVSDFNMLDPETLECPYPLYEALHAGAPVYTAPELGVTIVSSYDLLQEVVHDPETYSSAVPTGGGNLPRGREGVDDEEIIQLRRRFDRANVPTLLAADPPQHARYRSLVNKALAPRRGDGDGRIRPRDRDRSD